MCANIRNYQKNTKKTMLKVTKRLKKKAWKVDSKPFCYIL